MRDEPPQRHQTTFWLSSLRLIGEYGLSSNLALQANLGLRLVDTKTRFTDLAGNPKTLDYENIHHRNETVIGVTDTQLLFHGSRFFAGTQFGGRAGASLPTGMTQPNPYLLAAQGLRHEHLQFGTGTVDPLVGVDVSRSFRAVDLGGFGFAQLPLMANVHGFQAGARVNGGVFVSSSFGVKGASFRLSAIGLHEFPERWNREVPTEDGNQGRSDLYLSPGVTLPFGQDWSASLDVRVRAWSHTVNAQLDLPVVVQLSVGRLFHFESEEHEEEAAPLAGDVLDVVTNGELRPLTPVPGKWTVFDFWAPWCDACKVVDAELRERAGHNAELAVRRVNIVDFDSEIAKAELPGVDVLPRIRIVDPTGRTVFEQSGNPVELMRAVDSIVGAH